MRNNREPQPLRRLRLAGLIAILAGAAGSLGLLFHASHSRPPLLMMIFVIWVAAPFVGLLLADARSSRGPILVQATLYSMMLIVGIGSLIIYGQDAIWPRREQAAFVYVIVPPVSCLSIAAALAIAAFASIRRRRSDRA